MVLDLPFFSSVVLAATAVRSIGDPRAAGRILPGIAAGDTVATLALTEETGGWDAGSVRTRAEYRRGQWLLTGTKSLVPDGMAADLLLVAARSEEGLGLFALRPDAPGVARDPLPALDPTRPLARLGLSAAPAELLGEPGAAWPALRHTLDVAAVALAAEQAGGAAAALDMAVEYAGSREQFGRPIGGFQAIKHRCADMLVDVESARALAHYGLLAADRDDGGLPLAAATAKAYCSAAYTRCAEANVQIHGGIGFTWEHPAHLHLKRAKASEAFLGSPGAHLDAVATHAGY
jgi:alkylation response protein AidB-like acyl-CoA dehydrogenase